MSDLLQPEVWGFGALLVGLCVGSFLNVVIYRMPRMMERDWRTQCEELAGNPQREESASMRPTYNLVVPRSACPHCGHRITALENVPVISWLALGGKCSSCRAGISARYPVVEMLAGLVAVAASLRFGPGLTTLGASLFCWFLIALAFIDLDTQLLPDDLTFPLLWLGLAFNLGNRFVALPDAVIGAIAGYLLLWAVFWAFKLATGKEGMGYGDFKLLAALGAWLGWQALPLIVLLSSALGAAVGLGLMAARRRGKGQPIPFGPFLSFAGIIGMFGGVDLFRRWLWT